MIELIETPVASPDEDEWCYRKSLVILLSKINDTTYRAIILKSRKLYHYPSSKKKWKLIEKFKKEGCMLCRNNIRISCERKRIWLTLEEVIKLGHIYDSNIVEELKKVDQEKEKS
jgi:hypothetical protein